MFKQARNFSILTNAIGGRYNSCNIARISRSFPLRRNIFTTSLSSNYFTFQKVKNREHFPQLVINTGLSKSFSSSSSATIEDIVEDYDSRILSFSIKDSAGRGSEKFVLPYSYLRDVCQCNACFDPYSLARTQLMRNFDPDCTPQEISLNSENDKLHIVWNDGHKSHYSIEFLRKRNFTKEGQILRQQLFQLPQRIPWGSGLEGKIKTFQFQDLIDSDNFLLEFLENLCIYGLVLIENSPNNADEYLIERVAYTETTNYGQDFSVISKSNPSNLAYTSSCLGHHQDLPFYELSPAIQLLHCITQDGNIIGGENQFADGYHCSEVLKRLNPGYYDLLCKQPIDYYDYGSDHLKDFHLTRQRVSFEFDRNGVFQRIIYNNQVRDTYLNADIENVDSIFRALKLFDEIIRSHSVEHKLKSGEIAVFDNHRCLHARNSYEMKGKSERNLHGWYWRSDEIYSRIRRLKAKITGKSLI